ncbi:MAG: 16S rRNA (cytosine(967)-C(5))-methyltransferase RsmB [Candidatus Endonucleobacter sp. (ex Gigantidas childressi)]|nr:16S rRNA (cytosine(967)-C(5))-methyltransferase RsmB [Candidatus Endonucleobacter sp. (ex Gigantidas childressi)]
MTKQPSIRLSAATVVTKVVGGESLSKSLPEQQTFFSSRDQGLLAELSYGTLRHHIKLAEWLNYLMEKPLKAKDKKLHNLMLVGLYQLFHTRIPAHAAISETVQAALSLGKPWAKSLVNGVLRNAQRQAYQLQQLEKTSENCATAHPHWLVKILKESWPSHWQDIIIANNQQPPMSLRVNSSRVSRDQYLKKLLDASIEATLSSISPQALTLCKPVQVLQLPLFSEGVVSVQDESAQLAGNLIPAKQGQRILDACCAPGGKSCHILEQFEDIELHALDCNENRLLRVKENLERLKLVATIICGDATSPKQWWDGKQYDHILLDAPCSATGVIRRHPDIKLLRKASDITELAKLQKEIIEQMWPLLKPGGTLLYVTCSVIPEENHLQIKTFLAMHRDASLQDIIGSWGHDTGFGKQIFPGSGDGFFYSLISKSIIKY